MLNKLKRWDIWLFLSCSTLFVLFPQIDFWFASQFYDADKGGFFWNQYAWVKFIYKTFAKPQVVLLPLLIGLSIYCYRRFKDSDHHKKWIFTFLLCSLICGPGLLVNVLLKDNSIGRARPVHIVEYGGEKTFTRAFEYSGQCEKNCSFVSGHGSMGFFLIGLGWLLRSRRAFWLGFSLGACVGFIRVIQGGHFFSDVVLSFWCVYFVNLALAYRFKLQTPAILPFFNSGK